MIGKVIGAFVGDKLAKQTSGLGGAGGQGDRQQGKEGDPAHHPPTFLAFSYHTAASFLLPNLS